MKEKVSILDRGLCLELAFTMAREGYEVAYFSDSKETYPRARRRRVGAGFEEFKFITELDEALDFCDTIICPDTNTKAWLNIAKGMGKNVFGPGESEVAEHDRSYFKKLLKRIGLPVGPYVELLGTEELEAHLRKAGECYVKLDGDYRGDAETFKSEKWDKTRDEVWGHILEKLGSESQHCPFIVEQPLESLCEVGYDGLCIAGGYPRNPMMGYEAKDSAYVGRVTNKMPGEMNKILQKFAPLFMEWDAKTFYSNEVRIGKDGRWFYTDPTHRCAHPPFAVQSGLYWNLGVAVFHGAKGKVVDLENEHEYGAGLLVKSSALDDGWIRGLKIPKKFRHLVKLQNASCRDGVISVMPESFIACTAVGYGDSAEEAAETAVEVARAVDVPGKFVDYQGLQDLLDETIPAGRKHGIEF